MPKKLSENLSEIFPGILLGTTKQQLEEAEIKLQEELEQLLEEDELTSKARARNAIQILQLVSLIQFGIKWCNDIGEPGKYCFYYITLEWLQAEASKESDPDTKASLCADMNDILAQHLTSSHDAAINYVSTHEALNAYPMVKVNFYYHLASKLLINQQFPRGTIPFVRVFFDEPHQFTAMLIWLINKGVTPKQIIESGLLHELMVNHVSYIGTDDVPVKQVFSWLNEVKDNPPIQTLISLAKTTSCAPKYPESAKSKPMEPFQDISLTGETSSLLTTVTTSMPSIGVSAGKENIQGLYACFGATFLEHCLPYVDRSKNTTLNSSLIELFKTKNALEQLPAFIEYLSRFTGDTRETLFKNLAAVISNETLREMFDKTCATINFVEYKSDVLRPKIIAFTTDVKQLGFLMNLMPTAAWSSLTNTLGRNFLLKLLNDSNQFNLLLNTLRESTRIYLFNVFQVNDIKKIYDNATKLGSLFQSAPMLNWCKLAELLGHQYIKQILSNGQALKLTLAQLPLNSRIQFFTLKDILGNGSVRVILSRLDCQNIVKNIEALHLVLESLPSYAWEEFFTHLGANYIKTMISENMQLASLLKEFTENDWPSLLIALKNIDTIQTITLDSVLKQLPIAQQGNFLDIVASNSINLVYDPSRNLQEEAFKLNNSLLKVLLETVPELWPMVTQQQLVESCNKLQKLISESAITTDQPGNIRVESLNRIASLLKFGITHCTEDQKYNFYAITLEWLQNEASKESNPDINASLSADMNDILTQFLALDPTQAIEHVNTQEALNADPMVKVNFYYHLASKLLIQQSQASGIIRLVSAFFDEPHQFTAMLIWLMNKKITPQQVIDSGLLHEFIANHIYDIDNNEVPVKQVFTWLAEIKDNPAIETLIYLAKTTSCAPYYLASEKSKPMLAFKQTSLTGEKQKSLTTVTTKMPLLAINAGDENFQGLYRCFGTIFLELSLMSMSDNNNCSLSASLKALFKTTDALKTLPAFIEYLSLFTDDRRKKLLSNLTLVLSDETLQEMFDKTPATINFVRYKGNVLKPKIINFIKGPKEIGFLINQLTSNDWPMLSQALGNDYLVKILYDSNQFNLLLNTVRESKRFDLFTIFQKSYIRDIYNDAEKLGMLFKALPVLNWCKLADGLDITHVKNILSTTQTLVLFLAQLPLNKRIQFFTAKDILRQNNVLIILKPSYIQSIIKNTVELEFVLKSLPSYHWQAFIEHIGTNYIKTMISGGMQLALLLEKFTVDDWPHLLIALQETKIIETIELDSMLERLPMAAQGTFVEIVASNNIKFIYDPNRNLQEEASKLNNRFSKSLLETIPELWPLATGQQLLASRDKLQKLISESASDDVDQSGNARAEHLARMDSLVEFAIARCVDDQKHCFYTSTVEWLLDRPSDEFDAEKNSPIASDIDDILELWLIANPSQAIAYVYSQPKLNAYPLVKINFYYRLAKTLLVNQRSATGIIPLLSAFFNEPHQFAAMLIWLMNKGVTPENLINTGLLRQFAVSQIDHLGKNDSLVKQVFAWLGQINNNSKIQKLVSSAKAVACKHQGDQVLRNFDTISLTDEQSAIKLKISNPSMSSLQLTENYENIENLYACFGTTFLEKVLLFIRSNSNNNSQLKTALIALFKKEHALEKLPAFIDYISSLPDDRKRILFIQLGGILSDVVVKRLFDITCAAINFIEYKRELLQPKIIAFVTDAKQLGILMNFLSLDSQKLLSTIIGQIALKKIVNNSEQLNLFLSTTPKSKRIHFFDRHVFEKSYLQEILNNAEKLGIIFMLLPVHDWLHLASRLVDSDYIKKIFSNTQQLHLFLEQVPESERFRFFETQVNSYGSTTQTIIPQQPIQKIVNNASALCLVLKLLSPNHWPDFIKHLGYNHTSHIISQDMQLAALLNEFAHDAWPALFIALKNTMGNVELSSVLDYLSIADQNLFRDLLNANNIKTLAGNRGAIRQQVPPNSPLSKILFEKLPDLWPLATYQQLTAVHDRFQSLLDKLTNDGNEPNNARIKDLQRTTSLLAFALRLCADDTKHCFYSITMAWLLDAASKASDPDSKMKLNADMSDILNQWLASNARQAIKYVYSANELNKYPTVKVGFYHRLASNLLVEQHPASGIIPLLSTFFNEPHQFAALLLWLLEKRVPSQKLISSGILHQFVASQIAHLNNEDSPVKQVFAWISAISNDQNIKMFVSEVKKISCKQQDSKEMQGFEKFSLCGDVSENNGPLLTIVKTEKISLHLNTTDKNIKNLYQCFGLSFLKATLPLLGDNIIIESLTNSLKKLFATKEALQYLPDIIDELSQLDEKERVSLFIKLASVISDGAMKAMFNENPAAIHFIACDKHVLNDEIVRFVSDVKKLTVLLNLLPNNLWNNLFEILARPNVYNKIFKGNNTLSLFLDNIPESKHQTLITSDINLPFIVNNAEKLGILFHKISPQYWGQFFKILGGDQYILETIPDAQHFSLLLAKLTDEQCLNFLTKAEILSRNYILNIITNVDDLCLMLKSLPSQLRGEFLLYLPVKHINKMLANGQLALLLANYPKKHWSALIAVLANKGIIRTIDLCGVLEQLPINLWVTFLNTLDTNGIKLTITGSSPMETMVIKGTEVEMSNFCKHISAENLKNLVTKNVRALISLRYNEKPKSYHLSPEEFDQLVKQQLFFRRGFDYFIKKHVQLQNKKVTSNNFYSRFNDFCEIMTLMAEFFIANKNTKEATLSKSLKTLIVDYLNSPKGQTASTLIKNSGGIRFGFKTTSDRYLERREPATSLDSNTFFFRYEEFHAAIELLAAHNNHPAPEAKVPLMIKEALDKVEKNDNRNIINRNNVEEFRI